MRTEKPLVGRGILVTRPVAQAIALCAAIEAAGGEALSFPLLVISPVSDDRQRQEALSALKNYAFVIFISPNAVHYALQNFSPADFPSSTQPVTVGEGSAKALVDRGFPDALRPTECFDSEALLALPELSPDAVAGKRVLIFRGNGGRELLADTLTTRGAVVDAVSCYQRQPPTDTALLHDMWQSEKLSAITLSSSEALRHLYDFLEEKEREKLYHLPLFVSHQRIAENAYSRGCQRVIVTGAGDAALLLALEAENFENTGVRHG